MKKIVSYFLSCLLLLQTLAFSQTTYPVKQQVEDIYTKVSERVNSSPVLKDFKGNKITPMLALSVVAAGIQITTKEELVALLEQFNIGASPNSSVLDLYDATYAELKRTRVANDVAIDYMDRVYGESREFIAQAVAEEPNIVNYYESFLNIDQDLIAEKELQKLNIEGFSKYTATDLENARYLFENSCRRAKVNPQRFASAYKNFKHLPDITKAMFADEELLTKLTRQFSVYRGSFLTLRDVSQIETQEDFIALIKRYAKEFSETERAYFEQSQKLEELMKQVAASEDPVFCKQVTRFQNKVEDLNIRNLENNAKMSTLEAVATGRRVRQFTKNGGLFVGIMALFSITQNLIKAHDVRTYMASRNQEELILQDILEENKDNLFAFLEQLPDNTKDITFNYIAENYFDNFQNQTKNLLFALTVLERTSQGSCYMENPQQKVTEQFDRSYQNTQRKMQQNSLNI